MKDKFLKIEIGITLKEAYDRLKKYHGEKIGDDIALSVYNQNYENILTIDCKQVEGEIKDFSKLKVTEVEYNRDFYNDEFRVFEDGDEEPIIKKAYEIITEEIIEHKKLNEEEKFWKKTLLEAVKKENV